MKLNDNVEVGSTFELTVNIPVISVRLGAADIIS